VTDGATIFSGGLVVSGNGLTVSSGRIVASGGLTSTSGVEVTGGLVVTGGATVADGLVVTGGLTVYGAAVATTFTPSPSDRRLKTSIIPVKNALSKVTRLRGVYFNWDQNVPHRKLPKERTVGVIAQEVESLFPEVVSTASDGFKRVNYPLFIPIFIEAMRELNEMVQMIGETDISSLEVLNRLELLEARVAQLEGRSQEVD